MSVIHCPRCFSTEVISKGKYSRSNVPSNLIRRYYCKRCKRHFSTQTNTLTFKDKKPHVNQPLFRLINSCVSQRRAAFIFGVQPVTIARKLRKLSRFARMTELCTAHESTAHEVVFDEMETFEHTKCKPLSIAVAVEHKTRKILAIKTCKMPASGRLAKISKNKYGPRPDDRSDNVVSMLDYLKAKKKAAESAIFRSDKCSRYPNAVRKVYPKGQHYTFKGRRARVTGQGEMKVGGYDPLFSINHTAAMIRDNLKRLSRKTWATTKKVERLEEMLALYQSFHNQRLRDKKIRPEVDERPGTEMYCS